MWNHPIVIRVIRAGSRLSMLAMVALLALIAVFYLSSWSIVGHAPWSDDDWSAVAKWWDDFDQSVQNTIN